MDNLLKTINNDQALGRIPVAGDESGEQNLIPMMATPAVIVTARVTLAATRTRTVTRRQVTRTQRGTLPVF